MYDEDDHEESLTDRTCRIHGGDENLLYNFGEISDVERKFVRYRRMCEKISDF
jgi:hypothetical protein